MQKTNSNKKINLFESEEQVVKVFKADEGLTQNIEKLAVYLNNL